jgi:hypothetical protein
MWSLYRLNIFFVLSILILVLSCQKNQEGTVEGNIVPAGLSVRIAAIQEGKTVATVSAGSQDGKFTMQLPAGIYTISVTTPDSPYPLNLSNVVITSGETTKLSPIELAHSTGGATLSGKVMPPRRGSEVKLLYEGKERAAVRTNSDGAYEFKELPAGTYVVQANAPGHADDAAQVVIGENQKVEQNAVLFPITSIDGVDWAAGKIRVTGTGLPPQNAPNDSVRKAMAQRAALADAQRNLLRVVEQIRLDANKTVKTAMSDKNFALKIDGFVKGFTIVSERELPDGKIELVLELPLNGATGLSRYITE